VSVPTRQGWTVVAGAVAALVIGRVFALVELFVIGIGLALAVGWSVLAVRVRRPSVQVSRWIHPPVLTVGDLGRVDLVIRNAGARRSPPVELTEPVGAANTARMVVAPLGPGQQVTAGYRVPAGRRGVLELGPLELEHRDQLGLASTWRFAASVEEVMVAPRTVEVAMPTIGHGVLGRHLLTQAQRLGPGEFHSLRDYVMGDDLRTVHWRASARSEELKVRQHTTEGVRRCIVVLDRDAAAYLDDDAFERAIVVSASLVQSADRAGLTTRFVTSGGIDLRGPEVATTTLRVLAPIALAGPLGDVERDPGEGLGLVIVVTPTASSGAWRRSEQLVDPTLSRVGVFTSGRAAGAARLSVDASSIDAFRDGWAALAGHGGIDQRTRLIEHAGATT
jgi:uncharacterized protein (DUF58 family)